MKVLLIAPAEHLLLAYQYKKKKAPSACLLVQKYLHTSTKVQWPPAEHLLCNVSSVDIRLY